MNNLNNLRNQKFLDELRKAGDDGLFDWQLESTLKWKQVAIRSVASILRNQGKCDIIETSRGWIMFITEDINVNVNVRNGSKKNKKS